MAGNVATYTVVGLMLDSALVGDLARAEASAMLRANPMSSTILSDAQSIDTFADEARGRVELSGVKLIRVVSSTLHLARHMFDPAVRNARPTAAELKDNSLSAADREVLEDLDRMWNMIELENRGREADAPWAIPASAFDTLKKLGLFPYDARATVDDLAETLEKAGWIKVLFARDAQGRRKNIVLEPTLRFHEVIEAIDSGEELSFTPWKEVIEEAQKNSTSSHTNNDVTPPPNGGSGSATISVSRAPWDVIQAFVAATILGIMSLLPGAATADIITSGKWWSDPSAFVGVNASAQEPIAVSVSYPSTTDIVKMGILETSEGQIEDHLAYFSALSRQNAADRYNVNIGVKFHSTGSDESWSGIANQDGMVHLADGRSGLRAYGVIVPKDLAQMDIPIPGAATVDSIASGEKYYENVGVEFYSNGVAEYQPGVANASGTTSQLIADGRNGLRAYGIVVPKDLALAVSPDAVNFNGLVELAAIKTGSASW